MLARPGGREAPVLCLFLDKLIIIFTAEACPEERVREHHLKNNVMNLLLHLVKQRERERERLGDVLFFLSFPTSEAPPHPIIPWRDTHTKKKILLIILSAKHTLKKHGGRR